VKIKKANLKRLASLSALGAGALGVGGSAEASSIVYSGVLNEQIGFGPGYEAKDSFLGQTVKIHQWSPGASRPGARRPER
jgi:hypothetical protein